MCSDVIWHHCVTLLASKTSAAIPEMCFCAIDGINKYMSHVPGTLERYSRARCPFNLADSCAFPSTISLKCRTSSSSLRYGRASTSSRARQSSSSESLESEKSYSVAQRNAKRMELVGRYLDAARRLGVPEHDLFNSVDLVNGKDMRAVVRNLHSLGRVAQTIDGFEGPHLGAKLASRNERHFTEAQLLEARAMPSRWTNRGHSVDAMPLPAAPSLSTATEEREGSPVRLA